MKKFATILFAGLLLFASQAALAHTFATDGDITVLFHSNPDDDPIAGQSAAVLFQITDSKSNFDPALCTCTVTIEKDKKMLFNQPLLQVVGASVYGFTQTFTFPVQAVYHITVMGTPKVGAKFANFQVEYDLRVDRGTQATASPFAGEASVWLFAAGGAIFAIVIGVVIYFIGKKRTLN